MASIKQKRRVKKSVKKMKKDRVKRAFRQIFVNSGFLEKDVK